MQTSKTEMDHSGIKVYRQIASKDAALFLGISLRKLEKMRRDGDGPQYVDLGRNCIRYRIKDLMEFQEQHLRQNNWQRRPKP